MAAADLAMTPSDSPTVIRHFMSGDEDAFRTLNEEWIRHYFVLEAKDMESLLNPQSKILDHGGKILMAFQHGEPIGCCALMAIAPGEFEVAKMTVKQSLRGAGLGRQLLQRVIDEARTLGARRLYLETNHTLTPAIRLYESLGFEHLPPERIVPLALRPRRCLHGTASLKVYSAPVSIQVPSRADRNTASQTFCV